MEKSPKETFNDILQDYEEARPGYSDALFRDIIQLSNINENSRLLEIGCGTGQATEAFVKAGYELIGVELGKNLANYLKAKFKDYDNFKVNNSSFEDWSGAEKSFDLIISATAFHWVQPEIGYPKTHRLLKEGGSIALFWHMSLLATAENLQKISEIYRAYAPELKHLKTVEEQERIKLEQFDTYTKYGFKDITYREYSWEAEYSSGKYLRLLNSYSSYQMLSKAKRDLVLSKIQAVVEGNGGKINVPHKVRLYFARK